MSQSDPWTDTPSLAEELGPNFRHSGQLDLQLMNEAFAAYVAFVARLENTRPCA
jgi:hypothetical protein